MRAPLAVLVALVLAAGCLARPAVDEPVTEAAVVDNSNADLKLEVLTASVPVASRNLTAPPVWRTGEWWTYRVVDGFTGTEIVTTRVVAGAEGGNYLVGMPMHDFSNDLMVLHVPGFGEVARANLGFEIHDVMFEPLRFPIVDGASWETSFEGRAVTATASLKNDTIATVELVGANDQILVTYDAVVGEMTSIVIANYATVEITGHGYDFNETVTVPHMHDLVFQHFRLGGALTGASTPGGLGPGAPIDSVEVDASYDRASFVLIVGGILGAGPGYYKETATAPDGEVFELEMLPTEGAGLKFASFKHDGPGGVWSFQHVAAGPGITLAEGIAYHVYDVEMPSGRVLPSTGEHEHGMEEEDRDAVFRMPRVPFV